VILRRGSDAIIKQSPKGRAIYIYAAAGGLEEGRCYDLTVSEIGNYKGLKEITRIERSRPCGSSDLQSYYLGQNQLDIRNPALQAQVYVNLRGIYRHNHLEIDGKRIPIYFKKKRWRPADGTELKIHYGYLGHYRRPQLVILDRKDFAQIQK
jgi:hypothetical protein